MRFWRKNTFNNAFLRQKIILRQTFFTPKRFFPKNFLGKKLA